MFLQLKETAIKQKKKYLFEIQFGHGGWDKKKWLLVGTLY